MFLGEYTHSLDEKGRLTVPAKFRGEVEDGLVMTRGFDGNLMAFTLTDWDELAQMLVKRALTEPRMRDVRRLLFSGADKLTPDRQGRVLIPAHLRAYAGIADNVVITGNYNHFEIWNPEAWAAQRDRLERPDSPGYWNDLGI